MVNVAHDGDDGGARDQRGAWGFTEEFRLRCSWYGLGGRLWRCLIFVRLRLLDGETELSGNQGGCLAVNALVHRGKDTATDQRVDDVCRVYLEQRGKVANDDGGGQLKDAVMHLRNTCWLRLRR